MGMNTPEPAKALATHPGALEVWDEDPLGIPDDDKGNRPASVDNEGDLAAELSGDLGEGTSRLPGDDPFRGDPPPVEVLKLLDLIGFKSGEMTVDLLDGRDPTTMRVAFEAPLF